MTARQRGSACFAIRPLRLEEWARLGAPWARVRLAVMEAETIAEFGASAVAYFDLPADDPGQFADGCRAGRALAQAGEPLPIDMGHGLDAMGGRDRGRI